MNILAWAALIWGELVGLAIIWLSVLGYRNPEANRATVWLDGLYRRWSKDPDGGASFSHGWFRQNVWICGALVLAGLAVAIRELAK